MSHTAVIPAYPEISDWARGLGGWAGHLTFNTVNGEWVGWRGGARLSSGMRCYISPVF